MENPRGSPVSNVDLCALPPSYSSIFRTESNEHGVSSTVPPHPMSMPKLTARRVSELIPERNPVLEPENTNSVRVHIHPPNRSNEWNEAHDTEKNQSARGCWLGKVFIFSCDWIAQREIFLSRLFSLSLAIFLVILVIVLGYMIYWHQMRIIGGAVVAAFGGDTQ